MPVDASHVDREADRWNYRPEGPVGLNPLFSWPPDLSGAIRWYRGAWLELTALTVPFIVAVIIYLWFLPPLEAMADWHWSWVLRVYLSNLIPHCICAPSAHFALLGSMKIE